MKIKYLILSILAVALGLNHANAQENEIVQTVSTQNTQSTVCAQTAKPVESQKCRKMACSENSAEDLCAMQIRESFPHTQSGKLYRYTCTCGCHNHPVNNYSGLNSLTARLANRLALSPTDSSLLSATWIVQIWGKIPGREVGVHGGNADASLNTGIDGEEQRGEASLKGNNDLVANGEGKLNGDGSANERIQISNGDSETKRQTENGYSNNNDSSRSQRTLIGGSDLGDLSDSKSYLNIDAISGLNPKTTAYLNAIATGKKPVGVPVYFFFKLAKAELTDPSQLLNLDAIVTLAKEHNLQVRITGAADSATGTKELNAKLSQARAEYIATLLHSKGLAPDQLIITSSGGINTHSPISANRHCKVELMVE